MGCITRQSAAVPVRRQERVDVPECGEGAYVFVRELGAMELQQIRSQHTPPKADSFFDGEYDILARTLVDEAGNKLYENADDMRANSAWSVTTLQRLVKEALRVSGLDAPKN